MTNGEALVGEVNAKTKTLERDLVEANADMQASVRLSQRQDIGRARTVVNNLQNDPELQY